MNGDLTSATKEVIQALKPLAQKLGESAQSVYQMAVKDAVITGKIEIWACAILVFFVFMGFVFLFIAAFTKSEEMIDANTKGEEVNLNIAYAQGRQSMQAEVEAIKQLNSDNVFNLTKEIVSSEGKVSKLTAKLEQANQRWEKLRQFVGNVEYNDSWQAIRDKISELEKS